MVLTRSTSPATIALAAFALAHSTLGRRLGVTMKGHFGPGSSVSLRVGLRVALVDEDAHRSELSTGWRVQLANEY